MRNGWVLTPLPEVLQIQRRWVAVDPAESYEEIGVRSFGKGIFHKAPITGAALGNKRVLKIEPGDLVFNNVFGWEGAVAIASDAEGGKIGSHRFLTYTVNNTRADIRYLKLFFTSPAGLEILGRASPGSAGRNRTLSIERFFTHPIPLPPVSEQRRVVERIEVLETEIEQARKLRREADLEAKSLVGASLWRLAQAIPVDGVLSEVLKAPPRNGWSVRCDNAGDGVPVLSLGAVTGFRYRGTEFKRTSEYADKDGHFWLRPGNLLITRSNTPQLVGHVAIYDGSPSPCVYPDLMMRLDLREEVIDTRFAWYWLQSPIVRHYIERTAKGTSASMKKVSQKDVMQIPIPTKLSLSEQARIVSELDTLQAEVDLLKGLQDATATELDALLPAIIDRAFHGEL